MANPRLEKYPSLEDRGPFYRMTPDEISRLSLPAQERGEEAGARPEGSSPGQEADTGVHEAGEGPGGVPGAPGEVRQHLDDRSPPHVGPLPEGEEEGHRGPDDAAGGPRVHEEELGRDREQAPLLRGDHGRLQDHGQEVHEVRKIRRHGQGHPLPRGGEMAQEDHQGEREAGAPLLHRRGGPRSDQGGRHDEGQGPHLRRARARTCGEGGGKDTRVRQKARDDPPRSSSKPAAVATSNHPTTPPTSRG